MSEETNNMPNDINNENTQENKKENLQEKEFEEKKENIEQKDKDKEEDAQDNNEEKFEEKNIPEEILDEQNEVQKNIDNIQENVNQNKENNIENIINNKENIDENNKEKKEESTILKTEELKLSTPIPINNKEEKEKTISIIKTKIKEIKKHYNFFIQYHDILFKIIKSLEDLTYEKISNSIHDSSNYLTFFKNSSELYSKFAEQINNTNNLINFSKNPKMNDNFLNEIMQTTQKMFYDNLSKFSNGLKQNIISKGPLSKFHEKMNKIETLKKLQKKKASEIDEKKKKLEKKYISYQKIFETFLPENNNNNNEENNNIINSNNNNINEQGEIQELVDIPDFTYVTKDLIGEINELKIKNNLFIIDVKDSLLSINNIFIEINELVKESILIYIQESKVFFNIDVNKKFEEIESYYKKLDESQKDNSFTLEKIFNEQKDKESIFNLLQQYFELLNSSGKVKKELISDKNAFSIEKYENILLFFEWLISISPQPIDISIDDLIIKKFEIKRNPGVFSKWRNSIMIFTKQQHIIIFEKPDSYLLNNVIRIFELDKTLYKKKEDNKKKFLFELISNTKGKIMNFKGTFEFDALNDENINEISNLVTHSNNINK